MAFSCKITRYRRYGRECASVDVLLTVTGAGGDVVHRFWFDTGCEITTVSEDVALLLALPLGGSPVQVRGSTGGTSGRLVPVTFRFPPDALSGLPEPEVSSMWIVVSGRTHLALLSLQEVRDLYTFWTDDADMYFNNR